MSFSPHHHGSTRSRVSLLLCASSRTLRFSLRIKPSGETLCLGPLDSRWCITGYFGRNSAFSSKKITLWSSWHWMTHWRSWGEDLRVTVRTHLRLFYVYFHIFVVWINCWGSCQRQWFWKKSFMYCRPCWMCSSLSGHMFTVKTSVFKWLKYTEHSLDQWTKEQMGLLAMMSSMRRQISDEDPQKQTHRIYELMEEEGLNAEHLEGSWGGNSKNTQLKNELKRKKRSLSVCILRKIFTNTL